MKRSIHPLPLPGTADEDVSHTPTEPLTISHLASMHPRRSWVVPVRFLFSYRTCEREMVVGALADARLGVRLEALSLSRDELIRLLLHSYTREQLHLKVASMSRLPDWARDGVLLDDDLLPHVLADVPYPAAAAAVCSSWRRVWGGEQEWTDQINNGVQSNFLRVQQYAKMLREAEAHMLTRLRFKHMVETHCGPDVPNQPQHYVKTFGDIAMPEAVELGIEDGDLSWTGWTAYSTLWHDRRSRRLDLASNIECDENGNPLRLRKLCVTVPGRLFSLGAREVRAPVVVKEARLAQYLLEKYGPLKAERIEAALLRMYKEWIAQPNLKSAFSESMRWRIWHKTEHRALTLRELRSLDEELVCTRRYPDGCWD